MGYKTGGYRNSIQEYGRQGKGIGLVVQSSIFIASDIQHPSNLFDLTSYVQRHTKLLA